MATFVADQETNTLLRGVSARAHEHQECPICLDPLVCKPVSRLADQDGHFVCHHSLHTECFVSGNFTNCPVCGEDVHHHKTIPSLSPDPLAWFQALDENQDGNLSYEEILNGLKDYLDLNWQAIEVELDVHWSKWDKDKNGYISYEEFADPNTGVLAYLREHYPKNPRPAAPDLIRKPSAWFRYWDEDDSKTLDKTEIVRALVKTFKIYDLEKTVIATIIEKLWPIFDVDNSGVIEYDEFISEGNLGEAIGAEILHERGELVGYYDGDYEEEEEEEEEVEGEVVEQE